MCAVRSVEVVKALPFVQFSFEIDVTFVADKWSSSSRSKIKSSCNKTGSDHVAIELRNLLKRLTLVTLMVLGQAGIALAEGTAKDFVRQQAGKAALMADVEKIEFFASEMFHFQIQMSNLLGRHWAAASQ